MSMVDDDGRLRIGEILRYSKKLDVAAPVVDGVRSFIHLTRLSTPRARMCLLEHGINPVREIRINGGMRRPAVLIRSSTHRVGSDTTPWQDVFEPDNGYMRYFGDSKPGVTQPSLTEGNRVLLEEFKAHTSNDAEIR